MKKQFSVKAVIIAAAVSALLAILITLLFCSRFMLLDTRQEYDRKLAELSEKLAPPEDPKAFRDPSDKFAYLYDKFINNHPGEIDEEELETALLHGFADSIDDPYARYYSKAEYAAARSSGGGVGIGIMVLKSGDGRVIVTYVEKDGPADKARIERLDEIVAVEDKTIAEVGYDEAMDLLKGKENTDVKLTIKRGDQTNSVYVTRGRVNYATVRCEIAGEIGCVRILSFDSGTPEELEKTLKTVTDAGAKAIVFDLRDNTGGTWSSLHKCLDQILTDKDETENARLLFTINYAKNNGERYVCADEKSCALPAAVLINQNTAKQAEVFSQVLREQIGAKIAGSKSDGNTTVQSQYNLKDGSIFIFTTGVCVPASETEINGVGVTPDLSVENAVNFNLLPLSEDEVCKAAVEELKKEITE